MHMKYSERTPNCSNSVRTNMYLPKQSAPKITFMSKELICTDWLILSEQGTIFFPTTFPPGFDCFSINVFVYASLSHPTLSAHNSAFRYVCCWKGRLACELTTGFEKERGFYVQAMEFSGDTVLWFISNSTSLSHLSCWRLTVISFLYMREDRLPYLFFVFFVHFLHFCLIFAHTVTVLPRGKKLNQVVYIVCFKVNPQCWTLWSEVRERQSIWIKANCFVVCGRRGEKKRSGKKTDIDANKMILYNKIKAW